MHSNRDKRIDFLLNYNLWMPSIKITNWCDDNCDFCCECSGPKQPKKLMPKKDILDIADMFLGGKISAKTIIVSGGEPTASYHWGDLNYFGDVCNGLLAKGMRLNLKTNCNWSLNSNLSNRIFSDIEKFKPLDKYCHSFIFLSLDSHHKKSIQTTIEILKWYMTSENIPDFFSPYIFWDSSDVFIETWMSLSKDYNIFICNKGKEQEHPEQFFLENRDNGIERFIFMKQSGGIDNLGMAKINNLATKPEKTIVDEIKGLQICNTIAIEYDQDGMAKIFPCSSSDIKTPYKDNNGIKPLATLKLELLNMALDEYDRLTK